MLLVVVVSVGCGGSGETTGSGAASETGVCADAVPSDGGDACVLCTDGSCGCPVGPGVRGYACYGHAMFPACDDHCYNDLVARQQNDGPWFGCAYCGDTGN